MNGAILIIGSVKLIEMDASIIGPDGFVNLSEENVLISQGLDAYFVSNLIGRLPYAKPLPLKYIIAQLHLNELKNTKKEFLPQTICLVCNRPFTWRKKWEKVWEEIKYCSEKCKMNKHKQ